MFSTTQFICVGQVAITLLYYRNSLVEMGVCDALRERLNITKLNFIFQKGNHNNIPIILQYFKKIILLLASNILPLIRTT